MIEGTLLSDRYELGPRVGTGGMGIVHRAHDRVLHRTVAVKLLADVLRSDDRARARFTAEARAAAGLDHRNVVAVHDAGEHDGWPYFVMELVDGPSLVDRLAAGPLDVDEALRIGAAVADGLAAAHAAGIVHRDVKPANVLFGRDGTVKVSDFGIAAAAGVDPTTVHATLSHAAPELARGGAARPESDVYALGCLLTTMLTGSPPFPGETSAAQLDGHLHQPAPSLRSRRPAVPASLDALVGRMLAKEPGDRPSPMAEVRDRLLAAAADEPTTLVATDADATRVLPPPGSTRVLGAPVPTTPIAGEGPPPTGPVDAPRARPDEADPAGSRGSRRRSWAVLAVLVLAALATLAVGLDRADDAQPTAVSTTPVEDPAAATSITPSVAPTPEPAPSPSPSTERPSSIEEVVVAMRATIADGRSRGEVSLEAEEKLEDEVAKVAEEHRKSVEEGRGGDDDDDDDDDDEDGRGRSDKVRKALDGLADEIDERTGPGLTQAVADRLRDLVEQGRALVGA